MSRSVVIFMLPSLANIYHLPLKFCIKRTPTVSDRCSNYCV
nr:MAG TPA: hypothetical protein [Caudoviricetes sp.]